MLSHILPVDIAKYSPEWSKRGQGFQYFVGAKVAGMPDFIAGVKMPEHLLIEPAMGI
jgi:hypothetical protein